MNYTGEPLSTSYFRDIIGVTNVKEKSTKEIVLRFHNKEKIDNINKSNSKTIYYPIHNKTRFENKNIITNSLKSTHSGGGIIIQPGGGYKGN